MGHQAERQPGSGEVRQGNATLITKGVKVGGNIQAENHQWVVVRPRKIDGQVKRSRIDGSIQLKQGGGGKLLRNVVNSDIQPFSHDGKFVVRGNKVGGNLQCKSNDPRPVGGHNRVEGSKEDQCQGLRPEPGPAAVRLRSGQLLKETGQPPASTCRARWPGSGSRP